MNDPTRDDMQFVSDWIWKNDTTDCDWTHERKRIVALMIADLRDQLAAANERADKAEAEVSRWQSKGMVLLSQEAHDRLCEKIEKAESQAAAMREALEKFLDTWKRAGPQGSGQFEKFDTAVRMAEMATDSEAGKHLLEERDRLREATKVAVGMEVFCPKGHRHVYRPSDRLSGRIYCTQGDCWDDGCQGDSGSGSYYDFAALESSQED